MGKKRGKEKVPLAQAPSKPFNDAFSGLAALRDAMPDAPAAPSSQPKTAAPEPDRPKRGAGPKVVVTREKKGRAGKTVTRVAQLPLDDEEIQALQDLLKRTLGCGGAVEDKDVILSGDQTKRCAAWLRENRSWRIVVGN